MGVKSDKWIRRMAQTQGMITPFEPGQVKAVQRVEWCRNSAGLVGSLAELNKQDPDAVIEAMGTRVEPCRSGAAGAEKIVSYGTSSYGYDVRCGTEFKIFTNINSTVIDPKNFDERNFVSVSGESCIIPPNSFALGVSLERFKIPRDVLTICLGKSTYARCGIIVNVTPLEPEWEGHITMEFSNTTPLPARIYANEGCAQLLFLGADLELFSGTESFERKTQLSWRQHDPLLRPGFERQIRRDECETSYADRGGKYQNQVGVTLPSV